jgi:hypothetical protein
MSNCIRNSVWFTKQQHHALGVTTACQLCLPEEMEEHGDKVCLKGTRGLVASKPVLNYKARCKKRVFSIENSSLSLSKYTH